MASESSPVRRRPTRARPHDTHRDSNVVRASVLETALELGFGQNSAVADWIFNNPLAEEPEDSNPTQLILSTKSESLPDDVEVIMPTLISGSNSTSGETSSLNSPSNNAPRAAITVFQASHFRKPSVTESPHVHFGDFSSDQLQLFAPLTSSALHTHHGQAGSNSLGNPTKDAERSRSQDDGLRHRAGESPSPGLGDPGYASEGQYLSKGKPGKGSEKLLGPKAKGSKRPDASKPGEKDADYLSDGGYISASSNKSQGKPPGKVKSRAMAFFRRRPKKSARASDDEDEGSIPPVPAIPFLPRPSSPKVLERRATPSSPTRSGFTPLSLNLTSPPASPPRRRASKPPPIQAKATPSQRPDPLPAPQRSPSPSVPSASAPLVLTPAATAATFPLPPSMPGTPHSTASFPAISAPKSLSVSSSRQHLSIPPPAPPPMLPLPQPPPSPSLSIQSNGELPALPTMPTTPSRRGPPARPIPLVPTTPGSMQSLASHRTASPLRPLLSPRISSPAVPHTHNGEYENAPGSDQIYGKEALGRQGSGTTLSSGVSSTPAFLQRRIQQGTPPSPRYPPPDVPLPPSPRPSPGIRPRTPIGPPSKFHEHLSSVYSVPSSQVLSVTPNSLSPSVSIVTLSESSSGPSLRSSHVSSVSERSEPPIADSLNVPECSRPTTRTSVASKASYEQPVIPRFSRPAPAVKSKFSDRSDAGSSIYSSAMRRENSNSSFYDDNDADVDDTASRSYVNEEDDDASVYPSDDKTAGRRTMYLLEHGELDENSDEVVITGSHWEDPEMRPPVPPLPTMPTRPGPGYF